MLKHPLDSPVAPSDQADNPHDNQRHAPDEENAPIEPLDQPAVMALCQRLAAERAHAGIRGGGGERESDAQEEETAPHHQNRLAK